MANRHTHAKGLVNDAAERLRQPDYHSDLEAMDDGTLRVYTVTLLEQNLIVTGAVLEEVSTVTNGGWQAKMKAVALQTTPFAGVGGILGLLRVLGFI